jgi:hypothetical protein
MRPFLHDSSATEMLDLDQEFADTYLDILMRFYSLFEAIVRSTIMLSLISPLYASPLPLGHISSSPYVCNKFVRVC